MMVLPTTEFVILNGIKRCVHTWKQPQSNHDDFSATDAKEEETLCQPSSPMAVVIIYHGFLAHGLYPTVRYAAEWLIASSLSLQQTVIVVSADMRGHGHSEGLPGYIGSAEQCIADGVAVAKYAVETYYGGLGGGGSTATTTTTTPANGEKNILLLGSSMGGTIALHVARQWNQNIHDASLKGVILLAPMLQLKVSPWEETLLYSLTCLLPNSWPIIPLSTMDAAKQYRDEAKRDECETDPNVVTLGGGGGGKKLRLGSAYSCIQLVRQIRTTPKTTVPILFMVADEDVVVDPQGSLDYCAQAIAAGGNCTMKRYPALHGLLCEPKPLLDTIQKDMLHWIQEQIQT